MRPIESGGMSFPPHSAIHSAIDWEKRRYEIAKDALCAIISSDNHNEITLDCITAVNIADQLIKQLKGGVK